MLCDGVNWIDYSFNDKKESATLGDGRLFLYALSSAIYFLLLFLVVALALLFSIPSLAALASFVY